MDATSTTRENIDRSYSLYNRNGDVIAYRLVKSLRGMVTIKNQDLTIQDKTVLYTELDKVNHLNMMLHFYEEKDKQSFIDRYDCVVRFEDGSFMVPTKGQVPFSVGKNFQIIKNNNETFFGLIR